MDKLDYLRKKDDSKIIHERGDIRVDVTEIKRVRDYCE